MTTEVEQLKTKLEELSNEINELKQIRPRRRLSKIELTPVTCEICRRSCVNKYVLSTHMHNMHDEARELVECPHCHKKLSNKYYLKKHINRLHNTDNKENEQKWGFCSGPFSSWL